MLKLERLERISDYVAENKYATVKELSKMLKTSPATIRRDIGTLSKQNKVIVAHGGIAYNEAKVSAEATFLEKMQHNSEEKMRIAKEARRFVEPESTLIIDAGSTTIGLVPYLSEVEKLSIVTNDVTLAASLADTIDGSITMIGGSLRGGYHSTIGYYAERMLDDIRADLCIIGTDAISAEKGFMISNLDEVGTKRAMIRASKKVIVICDHTKFERESFVSFCRLDQVDVVVTGEEISSALREALESKGVNLIVARKEQKIKEA
ncbi:MAG: DeoR/GlpR transcriptional regulator [Lachnospiraceae bacterium]|nr:DeoR/GlpR transcriptional regulator [Lachnospiraceae bacterium]